MKNKKSTFLHGLLALLFSLVSVHSAVAGGSGSHAGGFVSCRDPIGHGIVSAELADLYLGRTKYKYSYRASESLEISELSKRVLATIPGSMFWKFTYYLSKVDDDTTPGSSSLVYSIENGPDVEELLQELALPAECKFSQAAAFFDDPDTIRWTSRAIDERCGQTWDEDHLLYGRLPTAFREGCRIENSSFELRIHEVIYKLARKYAGDQTSARTRRIVGLLFSDRVVGVPVLQIRENASTRLLAKLLDDLWAGRPFCE